MSTSASSSGRFPQLEKYELVEEIGHGGMATVYRARDLRLEREVAVKLIHKHLRENPEVRRRFVSEAKAVAKLRHPSIVEVYDVSADAEEERYLVVELIRGKSLRQVLQDHGVLPAEVAASIGALLCDAVEHAHQSGVIHRDIKPENVLIELPRSSMSEPAPDDGEGDRMSGEAPNRRSDRPSSARSTQRGVIVKLTDFGIAKVLDVQGVTSTGQILGSPAHMAPEQIEGGNVGPHTDVFALGVLMYEAMVGHLPFEGKNPAQVLRRVLEGTYEQADSERAEVGGRWASLLARTLDIDIDSRIPSCTELATLIDEELKALGVEDPRQELGSYFADPKAYREKQRSIVVQKLLKRGERERRKGHIQQAAADFNRALALRPDDLVILKRVSALSAQTIWRQRGVWLGGIALLCLVMGGAAYAITRLVASDDPLSARGDSSIPTPDVGEQGEDRDPRAVATGSPSDAATGQASAKPRNQEDPQPAPGPSAQAGTKRKVRFTVTPKRDSDDAKLMVDGATINWFGPEFEYDVDSEHQYKATVPGTCCGEATGSFKVSSKDLDKVQVVSINVPIKDATATLSGGPPSALLTCTEKGLQVSQGATVSVKMSTVTWTGSCVFSPGGKQTTVTLRAGQPRTISWPTD